MIKTSKKSWRVIGMPQAYLVNLFDFTHGHHLLHMGYIWQHHLELSNQAVRAKIFPGVHESEKVESNMGGTKIVLRATDKDVASQTAGHLMPPCRGWPEYLTRVPILKQRLHYYVNSKLSKKALILIHFDRLWMRSECERCVKNCTIIVRLLLIKDWTTN